MVADALSRKHVLVSTLSSKLMGFESLKALYPEDPHFDPIFRECKELGRDKWILDRCSNPYAKFDGHLFKDGSKKAEAMKKLHEKVRQKHEKKNQEIAKRANKGRRSLILEPGDWVWVHLRKHRFPSQRKTKLIPRGDGPFQVLERINDNAYKIDLPPEYQVHNTFNMCDLSPIATVEDEHPPNLRTNSLQYGEEDTSTTSSRPFTRSQVRELQKLQVMFMQMAVLPRDAILQMFHSAHYAGEDLVSKFGLGEPWKKVFGPVFIYLNSVTSEKDPLTLWEDAKEQMQIQVQSWPYSFPCSEDFPSSSQHAGSWQRECKDYQFWTRADEEGKYVISNIRAGDYNLYAFVPGFIGDYKCDTIITITSGCSIEMDDLVFEPPRNGPTLWEIGIPDRSAREFYIPDPDPKYVNKLFINHPDRFRQYGLWERYADLYPNGDIVFTIGESDYKKDWFFVQVTRKKDEKTYQGTTWQIKFKLENINQDEIYTLRLALASAAQAELQVRVNDSSTNTPLFSSGVIGKDNAIARHGIHGLYWLFNVNLQGSVLIEGENTIYLTQANATSPFQGIMYDYIRLEGPPFYN
ncbi:hypothetical protein T459_12831 [Capsicum annuum]|uniref:Rhamnogalacturonan endolyase n=1 Tax=Capsicum annuum TaxID=4072 RepID=A0A2G2ZQY8_CAPAN|nr:hypothetical protein T459_12831 [Capsicum annuum]